MHGQYDPLKGHIGTNPGASVNITVATYSCLSHSVSAVSAVHGILSSLPPGMGAGLPCFLCMRREPFLGNAAVPRRLAPG